MFVFLLILASLSFLVAAFLAAGVISTISVRLKEIDSLNPENRKFVERNGLVIVGLFVFLTLFCVAAMIGL